MFRILLFKYLLIAVYWLFLHGQSYIQVSHLEAKSKDNLKKRSKGKLKQHIISSKQSKDKYKHPASKLKMKLDRLFSHQTHKALFMKETTSSSGNQMKIDCQDCHRFSIKGKRKGILPKSVSNRYLKAPRFVCHQCHLGRVSFPRPNQCTLCHKDVNSLKPVDHLFNWQDMHGKMSQLDRDYCSSCHTDRNCSNCHVKKDTMNPNRHRANFRLTHSIEARAMPGSCFTCHRSIRYCINCHKGGLR